MAPTPEDKLAVCCRRRNHAPQPRTHFLVRSFSDLIFPTFFSPSLCGMSSNSWWNDHHTFSTYFAVRYLSRSAPRSKRCSCWNWRRRIRMVVSVQSMIVNSRCSSAGRTTDVSGLRFESEGTNLETRNASGFILFWGTVTLSYTPRHTRPGHGHLN